MVLPPIAIKAKGNGNSKKKNDTGLIEDIKMSIRSGPDPGNYHDTFTKDKIFNASGKSANIISGAYDMALLLDETQIETAIKEFREYTCQKLMKEDESLKLEDALIQAKAKTLPERIFREKMNENQALLVIYLFDPYYVFNKHKSTVDEEMNKFCEEEQIDLNVPLIGYAIGIPPIEGEIGGDYIHGNYDIEDDDDDLQINEEDSELPSDSAEV